MKAFSLPDRQEDRRRLVFVAAVFLFYLFYLFAHVNIYLFMTLHETWETAALPVLVAAGLYYYRYRDCAEQRLLTWFFIWFVFSRLLNGADALTGDGADIQEGNHNGCDQNDIEYIQMNFADLRH